MRHIFLASVFMIVYSVSALPGNINPVGTYKLLGQAGNSGKIQVKRIDASRILMTFEIINGPPGYHSGSFIDTLVYRFNKAIYTNAETDSTCRIIFNFTQKGVRVAEVAERTDFGCDFGHGVIASGFFLTCPEKHPI